MFSSSALLLLENSWRLCSRLLSLFCTWLLCILHPLISWDYFPLTSPWSLFLVLSSLRFHTSAASCQPGILIGLIHLMRASVSQGLGCKQIYTEAEREALAWVWMLSRFANAVAPFL